MKHVTFTRDMRPYSAGEMRLVPDDVAAQLEADDAIRPNPPSWPAPAPDAETPEQPAGKPQLRLPGRQRYLTK